MSPDGINVSTKASFGVGEGDGGRLVHPVTNAREETREISEIKYKTLDNAAIDALSLTTMIFNESF